MHVLAFVNQKGGCGKTTAAVNLAGALATRGKRVLLVDLDPQAHATLGLSCAVEEEPSLIEVLAEGTPIECALHPAPGGIELVPATEELAEFEEVSARMVYPEQTLAHALRPASRSFDFVLLDCPPRADGILTANALQAADTAVLVVECGAFALQGAVKAEQLLKERATERHGAHFDTRVLGTLFDRRTRLAREILIAMHARFGPSMFDTAIRSSVRLREAAAVGLPVQVLDPRCQAATEFESLAQEVCAHARRRGQGEAQSAPFAGQAPAGDTTQ